MAANICGACGADTVRAARFCHACGAPVGPGPAAGDDDVLVELDLDADSSTRTHAEPEPVDPGASRGPLLAGLAFVALVVVTVFVIVTGNDDAAEPDDAVDESPTTQLADPDAGSDTDSAAGTDPTPPSNGLRSDPLDWSPVLDLGETWPLAFVEHEGAVLYFAAEGISAYGVFRNGISAWRSEDGDAWDALGQVFDPTVTVSVIETGPRGLIAAGTDADGAPTVWRSADGVDWTAERLPAGGDGAEPGRVATNEQTEIVVSSPAGSTAQDVARALDERFGVDLAPYGFTQTPDSIALLGPFGLEVAEYSLAELGLDPEEISRSSDDRPATIWAHQGDEWQTVTDDLGAVVDLVAPPAGDFLIQSFGSTTGPTTIRSADGVTWSDTPSTNTRDLTRWGDMLIGRAESGVPQLRVSADGREWDTIALGDRVSSMTNPGLASVDAGRGGIALTIRSFGRADPVMRPATIIKDGFTLTTEGRQNGLVLSADGVEISVIQRGTSSTPRYAADLAAETVAFLDPETGSALVTFSFDDLRSLELATSDENDLPETALLVSADAVSWSLNRSTVIGRGGGYLVSAGVAMDRVFAVLAAPASLASWPVDAPQLELFSAALEETG